MTWKRLILFLVIVLPVLSQPNELAFLFRGMIAGLLDLGGVEAATLGAALVVALAGFLGLRRFPPARTMLWLLWTLTIVLATMQRHRLTNLGYAIGNILMPTYLGNWLVMALIPLLGRAVLARRIRYASVQFGLALAAVCSALSTVAMIVSHRLLPETIMSMGPVSPSPLVESGGEVTANFRWGSLVGSPNATGALLLLTWPVFFSYVRFAGHKSQRSLWLNGAAAALCVLALIVTYSRAAYLGLFLQGLVLVAIWLFSVKHRDSQAARHILLAAFVTVLAVSLLKTVAVTRFVTIVGSTERSALHRMEVLGIAARLFLERPLCGWGPSVFASIFRTFYRLPSTNYLFADAHSALALTLINDGVISWVLLVAALTGLPHLRYFRKIPAWIWLSVVGGLPPLLFDNPTTHIVAVPICLAYLAACAVVPLWKAQSSRSGQGSSSLYLVAVMLMIAWGAAFTRTPKSAPQRLVDSLEREIRRVRDVKISALVQDDTSGAQLFAGSSPKQPTLSALAVLGTVALATFQTSPNLCSFQHVPLTRNSDQPAYAGNINVRAVALALLAEPRRQLLHELLKCLPPESLDAAARTYLNASRFAMDSLPGEPEPCETCASQQKRKVGKRHSSLQLTGTTATLIQTNNLLARLISSRQDSALPEEEREAMQALRPKPYATGLDRCLPLEADVFSCSAEGEYLREGFLMSDDPLHPFQMIVRAEILRSPAETLQADDPLNVVLGIMGWRVWCYFQSGYALPKS